MNGALYKFLKNAEGERVWFAIPAGVLYGELQTLDSNTPEFVKLKKTLVFIGNKGIEVAEAYVDVSQISAWGDHFEGE